eukprot:3343094-Amphidinium_carterae.1
MNAGYFLGDSYRWAMGKEVLLDNLMCIFPPLSTRPVKEAPDGLFPQCWPAVDPEEPEPDKTDAQILATLVMDDYEHRSEHDYLSPGFPINKLSDPEQRIRRAGHWLNLSYEHMEVALSHAQILVDEGKVQYQGEVRQRPQETTQRGVVRHPTWTGTDQHAATVHIYPPREVPESPDTDYEAMANALPVTQEELEDAVNERLQEILTPNTAIATPVSTTTQPVAFTGAAHRLPADLDEKKDSDADVKLESKPE